MPIKTVKRMLSSKSDHEEATSPTAGDSQHDQMVAAIKAAHTPHPPATKAPKQALKAVYSAAMYKAGLPLGILAIQTFMAGFYIAMSGQLLITAGGGILGAALFPTGLIAVVLTSGELFTGDALIFVVSFLGGKVTWKQMARNWTVAWIGNFFGSLAWAVFLGYLSDVFDNQEMRIFAIHVSHKKAFQTWGAIFLKGIGANAMVCLGIWQATCAEEVAGKIMSLWFPVTAFVYMGFDHCIANQYLIPMGMILQAAYDDNGDDTRTVSVVRLLFRCLLPATLGNLVGGGFLIGALYWYAFDSMESNNRIRERIQRAWTANPRYGPSKTPAASQAVSRDPSWHDEEKHDDMLAASDQV